MRGQTTFQCSSGFSASLLLCDVLSLSNQQITVALYLLLNFSTIGYLVLHNIFYVRGWLNIFHLIISFFYLLYYNIKSWKITLVLLFYYLLSIKWNFAFTLRNSGQAKTWPTGPSAMALYMLMLSGNKR